MRFEIRYPDHREEVSSDSAFVVFGRDASCDVVIKDPRCSRRHASLRMVPEGFQLLDMGSSNGVHVLDQKVEDAIVREGDVFSMGDVFVRILPEDMDGTLAISKSLAIEPPPETSQPVAPLKWPVPPPKPNVEVVPRPAPMPTPPYRFAPKVLGISSIAIGVTLILGTLVVGEPLGVLTFVLPVCGVVSAIAGIGALGGAPWSSGLHYVVFAMWTLTCLLAPFGLIGLAYELRAKDQANMDAFFAAVIGVAGVIAVIALIVATFLASLYVPTPVPG